MSKPSILIVDADKNLSDILSKRFISAGWDASIAMDLDHTQKELEKEQFDVILIDPDLDVDVAVTLGALGKNKSAKKSLKIIHANASDRSTVEEFEKSQTDLLWLKGSISLNDIVKKTKIILESRKK
jgi:DNA-binding response OmpR family regulator